MDTFTSGFFLRFVSSVKTWSSSRPCPLHRPAAGPAHWHLATGRWLPQVRLLEEAGRASVGTYVPRPPGNSWVWNCWVPRGNT